MARTKKEDHAKVRVMWRSRSLGHGVGLRVDHFAHLLEHGTHGVDWFEIVSENFFEPGGRPRAVLDRVRAEKPVVMHGVSLGIGNVDPLDRDYLDRLVELERRIEPAWVSDHLCWGGYGGHYAHDLLPLPYTEEALGHVVTRIGQVQERLGRSILLENVSSYVAFSSSAMREWEFLSEIARRSGCGILLDVNNIYVSAANHNFRAETYVDAISADVIGQIHLAGHTDRGTYLFDSHIGPVPDPVWRLYERVVARVGHVPTLVEWDEEIPDYDTLVLECKRARDLEQRLLHAPRRA